MVSSLTQAWRAWRTSRPVALLAILALTVGIGSAVAIFTVANAVLLKPLPIPESNRWVVFAAADPTEGPDQMSGSNYHDLMTYKTALHCFDVFGWTGVFGDYNLTWPGAPQHLHGVSVTPSLLNGFGIPPALGRWFTDHEPAGYSVAVISSSLWKRLGSDPHIVGKTIGLNGRPYTVTGVAPPNYRAMRIGAEGWLAAEDVWIPIDPHGIDAPDGPGLFLGFGRLRPGVTLAAARAQALAVGKEIIRELPSRHFRYTVRLTSLQKAAGQDVRSPLLVLLGAAGLLLLITSANVSGLLVARSAARSRETAIRVALGAGAPQLAKQYFLEGLMVAVPGAILGIAGSIAALHLLRTVAAQFIPRANEIQVDWLVLTVAAGLAALCALLASFAPMFQALRTRPNDALTSGVRTTATSAARKLSRSLVILETALAFTLLAAAAVLQVRLSDLAHRDLGFNPNGVMTFDLQISEQQFPTTERQAAYQRQLETALQSIPGITNAGITSHLPLDGCCYTARLNPVGPSNPSGTPHDFRLNFVSPSYFKTIGLRLRAGRWLDAHDGDNPVVMVSEAAIKQYWPGQKGAGETILDGTQKFQVVGVTDDFLDRSLNDNPAPEIFFLNSAQPPTTVSFVLRSKLSADAFLTAIRNAVRKVNPEQPVYNVQSLDEIIGYSLEIERLTSGLILFFACASVLLASLGLYGVMAYTVRQRVVELGTRMALGAVPGDLLRMVIANGWVLMGYGVVLGGIASIFAIKALMQSLQLPSIDWIAFGYPLAIIAAVATLACFVPATRAAVISPMVAIREEPDTLFRGARRNAATLLARLSGAPASSIDALPLPEAALLSGFIDAARRAVSFEEALVSALDLLASRFDAGFAILLERSGDRFRCAASVPQAADAEIPVTGFLAKRLRFYSLPLPFAADDLDTWRKWAEEQKPEYLPEIAELSRLNARLVVGLRTHDELLGMVLLGAKRSGERYTGVDLRFLRAAAEQLALMLENGRLTGRIVEQEKLRRDVALAVEVQRRLLPDSSPTTPIGEIAAYTLPARSVGGDYYDFVQTGDGRIGIALADVAGKGVPAALVMAVVQASLRILASDPAVDLPELAAKMNRFLHRSTGVSSYATFFYAQVDEPTRELRYVNAGHNPPLLYRAASGEIQTLAEGGMVIGMFPFATYTEGRTRLQSGDLLLAFTDGVSEALNPAEEEFGESRLQEVLRELAALPAAQIAEQISARLRLWIATADQHDDITFVLLKVR